MDRPAEEPGSRRDAAPGTRAGRASLAAACLGWMFSAVDIVLLILFQRAVAEGLGVDVQKIRVTIGVGLLGSALGGVLFAQLGDRLGRVRALGLCVIAYSLATAGMALAPNVGVLMAMRFLSGVGTGGEWAVGFALVAEVSPRTGRGRLGGFVAAMFNLGTFLAILLFQSGMGWRLAFGVMALPALGVLWLRMTVPESPVWLALQAARARGEIEPKLEAALRRAPVSALFRGRLRGLTLKMTVIFTLMNLAFYAFSTVFMNYLQEDAARGGLGLSMRAQAPYQLTLNLAALASGVAAGALSDRLGRRAIYAAFCLLGCAGYAVLYAISRPAAGTVPAGLLPVFATITAGYGINGVVGTISSELFPTHLRSTGPGFCQNVGKGIGGMAGPPLAGALVGTLGYPVVLGLPGFVLLALAGLIWALPAVGGREVRAVEDDSFLVGGATG
jgi:MFS family permease